MMTLSTQSILGAPGFTLYLQTLHGKLGLCRHSSNGIVCVCPQKGSHFSFC